MNFFEKIRQLVIGSPRSPLDRSTRKHIALIAFLAWIGLGADGLSSSCYGPEQAFYALGTHTHLAIYLAIATALTVFLISMAYNQVIRLFPNGGGGYKVATQLIGPSAGLVSGAALIIDYMMTIAISIASGSDALFSLLPLHFQHYKLTFSVAVLFFILILNLRGAKESIRVLMPIFLGFFISHLLIIIFGITMHGNQIDSLITDTVTQTRQSIASLGWVAVTALFLRAYSLGAGTYTGIEAVSNNVHILAEPRVRTGRWTMFYMALSLSITAGGIIVLYLLWNAHAVPGQTLNAVVFNNILEPLPHAKLGLLILLLSEAGLLFVAANTGYLGGPAVLANMAIDSWVPRRFSFLSSRLVTQNGIVFFGLAALMILLWSNGDVSFLVVLYSMNVFLTFSISLLGLIYYWWKHRDHPRWFFQLTSSFIAFIVCVSILLITLIEKFELGGWITVAITSTVVVVCLLIKKHYRFVNQLKKKLDAELKIPITKSISEIPSLDNHKPTAVFLVKDLGAAMHALLWVQRMFPHHFKNFVFISQGVVDIGSFGSQPKLEKLKKKTDQVLSYLVQFSHSQDIAAESYETFGTDPVKDIAEIADRINQKYHNAVYFASRYVYPNETWITRILHSDLATIMQKRLHTLGVKMLVLPLNLKI